MNSPSKVKMTCGMESISRDGNCGRPATHVWIHRDKSEMPVCDRCFLSVLVCGGNLVPIDQPTIAACDAHPHPDPNATEPLVDAINHLIGASENLAAAWATQECPLPPSIRAAMDRLAGAVSAARKARDER